jgi:hypothetical protein
MPPARHCHSIQLRERAAGLLQLEGHMYRCYRQYRDTVVGLEEAADCCADQPMLSGIHTSTIARLD